MTDPKGSGLGSDPGAGLGSGLGPGLDSDFPIQLEQEADYRFAVRFGDGAVPVLHTDEPPPLGGGSGPGPDDLLGAAVANCLAASLLFAMRKFRNDPAPIRARAAVRKGRNDRGRLRVVEIRVELQIGLAAVEVQSRERILAQFEEYCVVTQSVRGGIPVAVRVVDRDGVVLHG